MANALRVGIVAPCSTVPVVEFAVGEKFLRSQGFEVKVHPQVAEHYFSFAGSDESRATAFFDYASDPSLDVIWSARGGYGASRLCRILDRLTKERGKPKHKLVVGYSDMTVLHEYCRQKWGWDTLHAPMPAAANFSRMSESEWKNIVALVHGKFLEYPATDEPLTPLANEIGKSVKAELIGGNLSLWAALAGTGCSPTPAKGKFLFLEDVDEPFYRLDRMMVQVRDAGLLDGAAAILLGDMTDCKDESNTCLAPVEGEELAKAIAAPKEAKRQPLRKSYSFDEGIDHIFTSIAKELGVPLYQGVRVGHGPNFHPLPLGATYELTADRKLKLIDWAWARRG